MSPFSRDEILVGGGPGHPPPPTLFLKLNFSFEFVYFIELRSVFISTIPTNTENMFEIMLLHCTLKGDPDIRLLTSLKMPISL